MSRNSNPELQQPLLDDDQLGDDQAALAVPTADSTGLGSSSRPTTPLDQPITVHDNERKSSPGTHLQLSFMATPFEFQASFLNDLEEPSDPHVGSTAFIFGLVLGIAYFWAQHSQWTDTVEFVVDCTYDISPHHKVAAKVAMSVIDVAVLYWGVLQVNILWLRKGFQVLFDYMKTTKKASSCCRPKGATPSTASRSQFLFEDVQPSPQTPDALPDNLDSEVRLNTSLPCTEHQATFARSAGFVPYTLLLGEYQAPQGDRNSEEEDIILDVKEDDLPPAAHRTRWYVRIGLPVIAILTVVSGIGVGLRAVPSGDSTCPSSVFNFEETEAYKYFLKVGIGAVAGGLMNLASLEMNRQQFNKGQISRAGWKDFSWKQFAALWGSTLFAAVAYAFINLGTCEELEKGWKLYEKWGEGGAIFAYGAFIIAGTVVNAGLYYLNTFRTIKGFNDKVEKAKLAHVSIHKLSHQLTIFMADSSEINSVSLEQKMCAGGVAMMVLTVLSALANAAPLFMSTLQHGSSSVNVNYLKFYDSGKGICMLLLTALPMWLNRTLLTLNSRKQPSYNVPPGLQSLCALFIAKKPECPAYGQYAHFKRHTRLDHYKSTTNLESLMNSPRKMKLTITSTSSS